MFSSNSESRRKGSMRRMVAVAGLAATAAFGLSSSSVAAPPKEGVSAGTTHLGVPTSDIVSVIWSSYDNKLRALDGSGQYSGTFAVPAGFKLVITDIQAEAIGNVADAGRQVGVNVYRPTGIAYPSVFTVVMLRGTLNDRGAARFSEHFSAGIPITSINLEGFKYDLANPVTYNVYMTGYLVAG